MDITELLQQIKAHQLAFTPTIVYLCARVANELPVFRQRIREDHIVEHDLVHPSFTVNTEQADVFSFCEVDFEYDYKGFVDRAKDMIARMADEPSLEDEDERDDYLFFSSIPWISFTSMQHAMQYHPHDSVPRIVWGKYYQDQDRVKMPLSVQVHHALVDGRDVGAYFQRWEALAKEGFMVESRGTN